MTFLERYEASPSAFGGTGVPVLSVPANSLLCAGGPGREFWCLLNCGLALRSRQSVNISSLLGSFALLWISTDMSSLTTPEAGWKKEESVKDWANKKKVSKGQSKKTVQIFFSITEISNMGPDPMFKYHGNPKSSSLNFGWFVVCGWAHDLETLNCS